MKVLWVVARLLPRQSLQFIGYAILLYVGLAWVIPHIFSGNMVFEWIVPVATDWAMPALGICLGLAGLFAIPRSLLLLEWYRGHAEMCCSCGGPMEDRHGRYGAYTKCLFCGDTQSQRY